MLRTSVCMAEIIFVQEYRGRYKPRGMTNYRIGPHRTISNHVGKREIVMSKAKPKSTSIRANKPPSAQLVHHKLGCHKSGIRTSVVYMSSTAVSITV